MNKFILILTIAVLTFMPFFALSPEKAEASSTTSFSQTILPPTCYDVVSVTGPTTDYIATFDCEYRQPDGTPLNQSIAYVEGSMPSNSIR